MLHTNQASVGRVVRSCMNIKGDLLDSTWGSGNISRLPAKPQLELLSQVAPPLRMGERSLYVPKHTREGAVYWYLFVCKHHNKTRKKIEAETFVFPVSSAM